jgi:hypothetical protein
MKENETLEEIHRLRAQETASARREAPAQPAEKRP